MKPSSTPPSMWYFRFSKQCCQWFRPSRIWCYITGWVAADISKQNDALIFQGQAQTFPASWTVKLSSFPHEGRTASLRYVTFEQNVRRLKKSNICVWSVTHLHYRNHVTNSVEQDPPLKDGGHSDDVLYLKVCCHKIHFNIILLTTPKSSQFLQMWGSCACSILTRSFR